MSCVFSGFLPQDNLSVCCPYTLPKSRACCRNSLAFFAKICFLQGVQRGLGADFVQKSLLVTLRTALARAPLSEPEGSIGRRVQRRALPWHARPRTLSGTEHRNLWTKIAPDNGSSTGRLAAPAASCLLLREPVQPAPSAAAPCFPARFLQETPDMQAARGATPKRSAGKTSVFRTEDAARTKRQGSVSPLISRTVEPSFGSFFQAAFRPTLNRSAALHTPGPSKTSKLPKFSLTFKKSRTQTNHGDEKSPQQQ